MRNIPAPDWMIEGMTKAPTGNCNLIETLEDRAEFTPDFDDLKRHKYIPVFIYQHELLQRGLACAIMLEKESVYLGKAHSVTAGYRLYDFDETVPRRSIAIASPEPGNIHDRRYLKGEVYGLSPRALLNVDRLQQNWDITHREMRNFVLDEQDSPLKSGEKPTLQCWIYLGFSMDYEYDINAYTSKYRGKKFTIRPTVRDYVLDKFFWVN